MRSSVDLAEQGAKDASEWRLLRLMRKVQETELISSFYFEPADDAPLVTFSAGQFLTLRIPCSDGPPVLRTYTISSSPAETRHYRLTVKREQAPGDQTDVPDGVGSCFLHRELSVGQCIESLDPRGAFVLDTSDRPVVLMSGGVGVTPMLAMFAELVAKKSTRSVWFIHACQDAAQQAMRDEVLELARCYDGNSHVISVHEAPSAQSDHTGRIDISLLRSVLPFDDYSFYLCGPPPFMAGLYEGLTGLNVDADRISYEFFGPATVLESSSLRNSAPQQEATQADVGDTLLVEFVASGVAANFDTTTPSLLALAKAQHIDVLHSCEEGICGTCRCRLLEGQVEYFGEPIAYLEEGEVLTCISRPKTAVKLDL